MKPFGKPGNSFTLVHLQTQVEKGFNVNFPELSFWIYGEISTVNGEHFIADIITMSCTREFSRGDKKNEL